MLKKLFKGLSSLIVVALLIIYIPYYFHLCDDCGEFFMGSGYKPNIVSDMISEDEQTICEDCAKVHHAISTTLGKSLDDYKKPVFVDPIQLLDKIHILKK